MDLNDQLTGLDYASPFMATSTHVYVPPWAPKRCGGVYIVMLDERNDGGFLPRFRLRGMSYLNITEIGRVTTDELHYHSAGVMVWEIEQMGDDFQQTNFSMTIKFI